MAVEATYSSLYDEGQVRCAQLGQRLLESEAADLGTADDEYAILDLYGGLEEASLLPAGPVQSALLGYLNEYYALRGIWEDPFLRPERPAVPAQGALVRRNVLGANDGVLRVNGALLGLGAELVPFPVTGSLDSTLPLTGPTSPGNTSPGSTMSPGYPITVTFTSQTQVQVTHNLGRQALVQVFDMLGQEVDADIVSNDMNNVTVSFSPALSGTLTIR